MKGLVLEQRSLDLDCVDRDDGIPARCKFAKQSGSDDCIR